MAVRALSVPTGLKKVLAEAGEDEWLVLHAFELVCNLVNSQGDVISLVNAIIGNGPFNIVVDGGVDFSHLVNDSAVSIRNGIIHFEGISISSSGSDEWEAKPDWEALHGHKDDLLRAAVEIEELLINEAKAESFAHIILNKSSDNVSFSKLNKAAERAISKLGEALDSSDIQAIVEPSKTLAGLGPGLTPAGDDLMMGVMHAMWATLPEEEVKTYCQAIRDGMAGKTTQLSAAWLRAAAIGQAGEAWHRLIEAILNANSFEVTRAARAILPTGHSSGADALGGFAFALRKLLS